MKYIIYIFLIFAFLISCEELFKSGSDDPKELVATVVGFNYIPSDTVSLGDTLTVEAIIVDSLEIKKQYSWRFLDTTIINNRRFISFVVSGDTGDQGGGLVISADSSYKQYLYKSETSSFTYYVE